MLNNQKSALMLIHKQLIKQGYLMLAQVLFHHLTGANKNPKVVEFLLDLFKDSN